MQPGVQIRVHARSVALPWAPETASRTVGQEARVRPDPSAVRRYQRVFPYRTVQWNRARQCFEVMEQLPGHGAPRRVTLVTAYETHPVEGGVWHVFQPFDHAWVTARLEEYALICREGRSAVGRRVNLENRQAQRRILATSHELVRDWMQEDRRWLPVLAAIQRGERPDMALTEKIPLVSVGMQVRA